MIELIFSLSRGSSKRLGNSQKKKKKKKKRFIHFMRAEVVSSSIGVFRWEMPLYFTSECLTQGPRFGE